jgi:serine/threonine-protein kinase RsbW
MGTQERRLTIPAVLEELPVAYDFVADAARTAGLDDEAVYHYHLSVEEVCTNVVEHGYHYQGQRETIEIVCREYPDRFSVTISDDAPPFNPLAVPEPDPSLPLSERKRGGWGIHFVRQYMDEVAYRYTNNQNHLMMIKYK